jgi:hypothetical protein
VTTVTAQPADTRPATALQVGGFALCLLVAAAGIWQAANASFFYADDYINFWFARADRTSIAYLKIPYFQHFAPGHRILDEIVVPAGRPSWTVAQGLLTAWYVVAVAGFWLFVRQLTPVRWLGLLATVMLAASPVWVRVMQWFASGAHVVPALACSAVFLAAAWGWLERRRAWMLVIALGALATGFLFYEKPALTVGVLVLTRYFVRAPDLRPAAVARRLLADWPLWAGVAVVAALYYAALRSGDYLMSNPSAGLDLWQQYLRLSWTRGTTPLLLGQNVPTDATSFNEVVVVVGQLAFAGLVAFSVLLFRNAWRAWVAYGIQWVAYVGLMGTSRLGQFGPSIGYDLRYTTEFALLLPLAVVLAFSGPRREGSAATRVRRTVERVPRAVRLAAPVLLAAVIVASGLQSGRRVEKAWAGSDARAYMTRFTADLDALRAQGLDPTLVDAETSGKIDPAHLPPTNTVGTLFPAFDRSITVGAPGRPAYVIEEDGSLRPQPPAR